jgi:hypothetical protein
MAAAWAATAAGIVAFTDYAYWGSAFSSAIHAFDYTVVRRLSSRGYEPFYAYLLLVPAWTSWTILALAILGTLKCRVLALWTWVPIVVLSCLPHKEARYLIPVIPFVAIAAARGTTRVLEFARRYGHTRPGAAAAGLAAPLLALALLHDAGGWRLPRSNEGVRLAQYLRQQGDGGLAVEQSWRIGGRLYLAHIDPLIEFDERLLEDHMAPRIRWIAVDVPTASRLDPLLSSRGFRRDTSWRGNGYALFTRLTAKP